MSKTTPPLRLLARWQRAPRAGRWQTLQMQLSEQAISDASHWTRRSIVSCGWRALPADASRSRLRTA